MDEILGSFAEFATTLSYRDLPAAVVDASKDRLLDTLGCAVGAYDCDTAEIGRSLAAPPARERLSGRIVGWNNVVAADAAAFVNSCMIRYLDLNDGLTGGHPSDALGGIFAVAPQIGASGQRLIAATVVAYEIITRLQIGTRIGEKGWDQGFVIGVGTAAGVANLMGLSREETRHAIAITAVANMPMRATRAGQLSMWKGVATAYAVRNAVFGAQLAAAGMTGPEAPFTGRDGLMQLITGPFEMEPFGTTPDDFLIRKVNIKYWPVAYSLQALIWAAIELRQQVSLDQIVSLDVQTSHHSWSESGSEPAKWDPTSRETADHSIPYVLAWTLRHGSVDHHTFAPESYLDPSIRPLMNMITVGVDDGMSEDAKRRVIRMRVSAKDRSGKSYESEIVNPLGHALNPVTAEELATKFERLCAPMFDQSRIAVALEQWKKIEAATTTKGAFDALAFDSVAEKAGASN